MTESTDKPLRDEAPADEQQLDEYLQGDSSVSRQYRQLYSAEVPSELDRLVLRQAEDAVKSRPARGRPAWVRWTAPLAVAASAVLVLSIVIESGVRDETAVLHAPQPTTAESEAEAPMIAEQAAPAASVKAPIAPSFETPIETTTAERLANRATPQQMAPAPPPPAEAENQTTITSGRVSRAQEEAKRALNVAAAEDVIRMQKAAADEALREQERSAPQRAYSRPIKAPPVAAPARIYTDPEEWLRNIRELRKENRQEQADREWRRFRDFFPNYEVAETDTAREARR